MESWKLGVLLLGAAVVAYAAVVLVLIACGRRADARAIATFIPDAFILFRRLSGDPRIARRHRVLLLGTLAYLATPIDLVPDFVPVAGQADDAIVVALVLRAVLRGAGRNLVDEHWPGPQRTLGGLTRLVFGRDDPPPAGRLDRNRGGEAGARRSA